MLTSSCNQKKDCEWTPIFNGKDLTGWSPKFTGEVYGTPFKLKMGS